MTRIKQFANDMGLSYNQAKGLVMQGRKKKDGGSTVLEKFMPIEIVPKRKTDRARSKTRMKDKMNPTPRQKEKEKQAKQPIKKQSGGGFDDEFRRLQALNREFDRARQKPEAQKRKESLQRQIKKSTDKGSKSILTRELKAGGKKGINRNLLDDKFLTDEELKKKYPERQPSKQKIKRAFPYAGDRNPGKPTQKPTMTTEEQIREIEKGIKKTRPKIGAGTPKMRRSMPKGDITKKMNKGGSNKIKKLGKPHKLEKYLTKEEIKKIGPMGTELLLKVQEGVMKGRKKADGGVLKELPPASENPGLRKLPTEVRNKMGYKKKGGTMKMMGGGTYNMMPRKMSKGGVARGTGAAVKGTGFKGVY